MYEGTINLLHDLDCFIIFSPQLHHFQNYIARFGHGSAKLARQAQSKEKTLSKMVAGGLTEKVVSDKVSFHANNTVCR